jgi:hypothetical protein
MNLFESLQRGQRTNRLPRSLLSQPDFIETLQVQPEFRTGAKEMSQTQRRVASDGPPPIQDFGDAIGWNPQLPRQLRSAHSQRAELLGQVFPGMNCSPCHGTLLMVINNLHIDGSWYPFAPEKRPVLSLGFLRGIKLFTNDGPTLCVIMRRHAVAIHRC